MRSSSGHIILASVLVIRVVFVLSSPAYWYREHNMFEEHMHRGTCTEDNRYGALTVTSFRVMTIRPYCSL